MLYRCATTTTTRTAKLQPLDEGLNPCANKGSYHPFLVSSLLMPTRIILLLIISLSLSAAKPFLLSLCLSEALLLGICFFKFRLQGSNLKRDNFLQGPRLRIFSNLLTLVTCSSATATETTSLILTLISFSVEVHHRSSGISSTRTLNSDVSSGADEVVFEQIRDPRFNFFSRCCRSAFVGAIAFSKNKFEYFLKSLRCNVVIISSHKCTKDY